jgi:hypothetical protein
MQLLGSGKCIGKKNLLAFKIFVSLVCFQIYFLLGSFIYYFIANAEGLPGGGNKIGNLRG